MSQREYGTVDNISQAILGEIGKWSLANPLRVRTLVGCWEGGDIAEYK